MIISLSRLPAGVRQAYEASAAQAAEALNLEVPGAAAEIEAIAVIDSPNGMMYTTRDGGQSFKVNAIAETIHLKSDPPLNEGISVRRVIRISHAGS
jgi:hypothetical protein